MTTMQTTEWYFPVLAALPNTTTTNWPQLNAIYIPETGATFVSCYVEVTIHDLATASANFTAKNLNFRLGAAGYTAYNWTQTYTGSGENVTMQASIDVTAHFTANWTGTSMTADLQALFTQQANGFNNCTAKLVVTYSFDETVSGRIKTVRIPLSSTYSALATTRPASLDTIPALDTYLPETSKTIRQITLIVEGNHQNSTVTTDITLSMEIDTDGVNTSGPYERALATARYFRYTWQPTFTTNATHEFRLWANVAACNSPIVYMVVTYEYDKDSTTILNSILLDMEIAGPIGLSTTEYSTQERYLWIEEPGTITVQRCACLVKYHTNSTPGNINHRVKPSATWVQTTSSGSVNAGSFVFQINANALSLARGRNTIGIDLRSTSTTALMTNVSSQWIINYTSGNGGVHRHNTTTLHKILTTENKTASRTSISPDFSIPDYSNNTFRTSTSIDLVYMTNTTGNVGGLSVQAQLRSGATHTGYVEIYSDHATNDAETGIRHAHAQARDVFHRWTDDIDPSREALTDDRKFKFALGSNAQHFPDLTLCFTTHKFATTAGGTITGGTTNAKTVRVYTDKQGLIHEEVIAGVDTAYTFIWYDDIYEVAVSVTDNVTGDVASKRGLVSAALNVAYSAGGGPTEYGHAAWG